MFGVSEVKYVGHILSGKGIKPDPDKVEAIRQIPAPTNSRELSRFLGMLTYLAKFIPNLSSRNPNLRNLLKKDDLWLWTEKHEKEFNELKDLLSKAPLLQFYDHNKAIVLSVDASKDGLGAVLLQDNAPVAYASKSLSETQQRYAQIEKEMLAITFGCQRFDQYLFGRNFTVETDHKPLEAIFKKPLSACPLRIQRLRITLQNYTFTAVYKPGSKLYIADTLSRASYNNAKCEINENEYDAQVHLIRYCDISPKKFEQIQTETLKDEELVKLSDIITQGWPNSKAELHPAVFPYWAFRDELVCTEGVICKGNQIVIPKSLRRETIDRLHYNHLGIEKTILRAKELVFWPFMNKEITDVVTNCPACLKFQNSNQEETLINREIPGYPWQIVAADLFHLNGEEYLLIVDTYSKYPEFVNLGNNTTHNRIIEAVKAVFARHGKPEIFYSGNDVQFINIHFQNFLQDWEITHKTSSPRNPKSNGFIERHVQTIKKVLKKALYDSKDVQLTLLEYRNTPLGRGIPSPAQLLFGRRMRGIVPMKNELLKPEIVNQNYQQILGQKQIKQKAYHDNHAMDLKPLDSGNLVMVQITGKNWEPGKVVSVDKTRPRTYVIKLRRNDKLYVRNRKYLRKFETGHFPREVFYDEILDNYYQREQNQNAHNTMLNPRVDNRVVITPQHNPSDNTTNDNAPESTQIVNSRNCENTGSSRITTTRSGRDVRKPVYLRDYV